MTQKNNIVTESQQTNIVINNIEAANLQVSLEETKIVSSGSRTIVHLENPVTKLVTSLIPGPRGYSGSSGDVNKQLTYDSNGLLVSVLKNGTDLYTYEYDLNQNLQSIVGPTTTKTFIYDSNGLLIEIQIT